MRDISALYLKENLLCSSSQLSRDTSRGLWQFKIIYFFKCFIHPNIHKHYFKYIALDGSLAFMVFSATFNNIVLEKIITRKRSFRNIFI